jgi:hypothetical protein
MTRFDRWSDFARACGWWQRRTLGDELEPDARRRFQQALRLAGERLDVVDVLRDPPHRAESIRVLVHSIDSLEQTAAELRRAMPASALDWSFRQSDVLLRELREASPTLAGAGRVDAALSPDELRAFRFARPVARRLHSRLRFMGLTNRSLLIRRVVGSTSVLAILAVIALGPVAAGRVRDRFHVTASSHHASYLHDSPYRPERAVDGAAATEWLTADGVEGWLELTYREPVAVEAVELVNAHNPPFEDRGTKILDIALYSDTRLLKTKRVVFDAIERSPSRRTVRVAGSRVTRVRLVIHAHHGLGAGLAEVLVQEATHDR